MKLSEEMQVRLETVGPSLVVVYETTFAIWVDKAAQLEAKVEWYEKKTGWKLGDADEFLAEVEDVAR